MRKLLNGVLVVLAFVVLGGCGGGGGGSSAGDIETWLIEVGNDFPDAARCVAAEMKDDWSVSDFEKSFDGEVNDAFETELDAVYEVCEDALGITSEE